ncbi:MAG TPA: DinB family protein [Gemmatimonadales bacterium]|nr:DinB family protein [Gemmatimonadales bacterium]
MPSSQRVPSQQPPWLRGPISGIPALLQPVAHALVDAEEDTRKALATMTAERLNRRPGGGAASAAYHVKHAMGSLDRLFTYARGESLSNEQLERLSAEKTIHAGTFQPKELAAEFSEAIRRAHAQLRATRESELLTVRLVGRAKLPSNTIGLLVHAAEHTARHVGQLMTTAKVLAAEP